MSEQATTITIDPPDFRTIIFRIIGTAPLMQAKFAEKARQQMREKQQAGSTAKKGKAREPRDFQSDYEGSIHRSAEGWAGIPASAFRNAAIDACRMAGFQMTRAKMSIFVAPVDGYDETDGTPLLRIVADAPEQVELMVRNATGVADIRVRPLWRQWEVMLPIQYDAGQFTATDVTNLLLRAGMQVGVGEGRPFSKSSNGMGFGTFTIEGAP